MTQIKWFHAFLVFFLLRVVYFYCVGPHDQKSEEKQEELAPKKKEETRERKIGKP